MATSTVMARGNAAIKAVTLDDCLGVGYTPQDVSAMMATGHTLMDIYAMGKAILAQPVAVKATPKVERVKVPKPQRSEFPAGDAGEIAFLRATIAHTASQSPLGKITVKRSEKGAMSIYGMGRFPFTFYRSQWERFSAELPAIQAWFDANKDSLVVKD